MLYTGYGVHRYHRRYNMDNCNYCNVELVAGYKGEGNWNPTYAKISFYCCKFCYNKNYKKRNSTRMWVNGEYISTKHPLYKPGRYKTFDDAAFQSTYKLDSIKEGYVYAITNPAWPEWVKIGMAIDANDRCNGYQTSSPFRDYKIEHVVVTNNRRAAEAEAHKAATKMAKETRGEWFKLDIELAKTILNNITTELKKGA
tara:strand:- start:73 stop:669 length:597 start_codon:yes stop_codon:yes gene_type:complete